MRLADLSALPPTLRAEQVAELFDCSTWSVYEAQRRGDFPVPAVRVGRSLRWPTARCLEALGLQANGHDPPPSAA